MNDYDTEVYMRKKRQKSERIKRWDLVAVYEGGNRNRRCAENGMTKGQVCNDDLMEDYTYD